MLKHLFWGLLLLLPVLPLLAQDSQPTVEIVLSTKQAQQGDTVYADVVIHNGHAIAGADIGITVDSCLRIVDRQPGNYLPSTSGNGGFSPFAELSDTGTRFAATVTDRSRIANGDGTFFRAVMKVTCDKAVPNVKITFAQLAALAKPTTDSTELLGYSLDQGNLSVVNQGLTVQKGVAVSTPAPLQPYTPPVTIPSQSLLLDAALAVLGLSIFGMLVLVIIYRRQRWNRKRSRT